MKQYLLISLLFCAFNSFAYAQQTNCGTSLNCDPLVKYPYANCDGNIVCSNNPLQLQPSVVQVEIPICLDNVPTDGPSTVFLPGGAGLVKVFDMLDIQNDINCAQDQWACICGKQNTPCKCHIDLVWSKNPAHFLNSTTVLGEAWPWKRNCKLNCKETGTSTTNKAVIYLNNCTEFVQISNGIPHKALVNGNIDYSQLQSNPTSLAYNLCDLIAHEMGHLYGLSHYDENIIQGKKVIPNCNPITLPTTGLMVSKLQPNNKQIGLSKDDKCAFARLYCNAVHVEDSDSLFSDVQIKTYPTPTQNLLNIEFSIDRNTVYLIFQVFNESGKLMYDNGYFYNNTGLNRITEDFSFLSNGTYYFKIYSEINVFSGKFVIAR
ncbi:MAG: T9SS type A sorting domain-containing protein [bacterium]